jgi:hypothetical protein
MIWKEVGCMTNEKFRENLVEFATKYMGEKVVTHGELPSLSKRDFENLKQYLLAKGEPFMPFEPPFKPIVPKIGYG